MFVCKFCLFPVTEEKAPPEPEPDWHPYIPEDPSPILEAFYSDKEGHFWLSMVTIHCFVHLSVLALLLLWSFVIGSYMLLCSFVIGSYTLMCSFMIGSYTLLCSFVIGSYTLLCSFICDW